MKYADALRVLARLEGGPEEEVEAGVGQKFEYVVTCQIYGRLQLSSKPGDRWKAQCIDALRHEFAHNLKVTRPEPCACPCLCPVPGPGPGPAPAPGAGAGAGAVLFSGVAPYPFRHSVPCP